MKARFHLLLLGALLLALAAPVQAHIYVDENFEGVTAFADRDWVTEADLDNTAPTPATVAEKGAFIRCYYVASGPLAGDYRSPKPTIFNTGSITSARRFLGLQSLELQSGESCGINQGYYRGFDIGEKRLIQFALSVSPATAQLPVGTVVGQFTQDWSANTTGTIEGSTVYQFRVATGQQIEIYCTNTTSVVGAIGAGPGNWALLSFVTQIRPNPVTINNLWQAQNPFTLEYIGPSPASGTEPTSWADIQSGEHVYINSRTESLLVQPAQIATGWGNDNTGNTILNTCHLGWKIEALNGGTIYIDDFYWDNCRHSDYTKGMEKEQGARIKQFNQSTTEPAGPAPASAQSWELWQ